MSERAREVAKAEMIQRGRAIANGAGTGVEENLDWLTHVLTTYGREARERALLGAALVCIHPKKFAGGPSPTRQAAWRECEMAIRALAQRDKE